MRQRKSKNIILLGSGSPGLPELTKSELGIVSGEVFVAAQAAIED